MTIVEDCVKVGTFDVTVDDIVGMEVQEASGSSESDVGANCPA